MTEAVPVPLERFVAELRDEEKRRRAHGLYEAAASVQRLADIIEQTGSYPSVVSYADRGAATDPDCYLMDGLLCLPSSDGAVCLALTEDRAFYVFVAIRTYLKITPEELREIADVLEALP